MTTRQDAVKEVSTYISHYVRDDVNIEDDDKIDEVTRLSVMVKVIKFGITFSREYAA